VSALTPAPAEWWRPERVSEDHLAKGVPPPRAPEAAGGPSTPAFRALLTFTFINILAPQQWVPQLRPLRIALIAAVTGIAVHLVHRYRLGRPLSVWGREMALLAALVAWAVVTVPFSYWPGGSVSLLTEMYFKAVAIFWLLANCVDSLGRLRTLVWSLTGMSVVLVLTAVKNFLSGESIGQGRISGYEAALTANPNDLALMLNILLPIAAGLLAGSRGHVRAILLSIIALQAAGVIVTFSRGGFLGLVTTLAIYALRLAWRGKALRVGAALVASLALLPFLPNGYVERLATITDIDSDPTGSAQVRWGDNQAAVDFVQANPLTGAGVGMDALALNEMRGNSWVHVHNVYLQFAVDLGAPGLVLFVMLLLACLKHMRRIRRSAPAGSAGAGMAPLAEGIEIALVAYAVGGFFGPTAYHFYFYYVAGLAVAAGEIHRRIAAAEGDGAPGTLDAPAVPILHGRMA